MRPIRRRALAAVFVSMAAATAVFLTLGERLLRIDTDDGVTRADAVIILAGALDDDRRRVTEGVGLYARGRAGVVVLPLRHETFRWRWAVDTYGLKSIVPKSHLLVGHAGVSDRRQAAAYGGTYLEARQTLFIMKANGLQSAIIVTSAYHTRRARLIFERIGQAAALKFVYHPVDRTNAGNRPWWLDASYLKTVLSEYRKLFLAQLFYPHGPF